MHECTANGRFRHLLVQRFGLVATIHSRVALKVAATIMVMLIVLGLSGCSRDPEITKANSDKRAEPITDEDFSKMRIALEQAIAERNRGRFVALFSKPQLFKLVFDDIKLLTSDRRKLESNINRGGNLAALISGIFSGVNSSGTYEFVKRLDSDGGCAMLFRFVPPAGNEIAYHRYELCRGYKARVYIRDIYLYLDQISLSKTLRQQVIKELQSSGELESESGADLTLEISADQTKSDAYKKYLELASSEQWQKAWVAFEKLPESVRKSSKVAYQRVRVAERLGDLYVTQAIDDSRAVDSKNLRTEYFAYNFFRERYKHQQVIEAVNRMTDIVDDPYLRLLKLDALIGTDQISEARKTMDEFLAEDSRQSRRVLIHQFELANAERDFESCVQLMDKLKSSFGLAIDNLSKLPRYANLLKSPEYREWSAKTN